MPTEFETYSAELAIIRRDRRRSFLLLFVTPLAAFLTEIASGLSRTNLQWVMAVLLLAGFGGAFAYGVKFSWSRCPRCRNQFFMKGILRSNGFARKCVHCGLPLS
ncbi:MAG: hypothetical protein B6D36_08335 [Planctomycetes bacterium UTPLA1]|nr:MAG: hypothetical protein B6D36_08335 [Planctomycetes bacterium UTPLA1]